jgi:hypothetical protein
MHTPVNCSIILNVQYFCTKTNFEQISVCELFSAIFRRIEFRYFFIKTIVLMLFYSGKAFRILFTFMIYLIIMYRTNY